MLKEFKEFALKGNAIELAVGVVVGTANNGQCVINGITESGNTLSQADKTAPTGEKRNYYGRFVPAGTGTLTIDGVAIN